MSELVRVTRGIWRAADAVDAIHDRAAALLAAAPEGTIIGGVTAAYLHGLWLPEFRDDRVELVLRYDAEIPEAHAGSRRREVHARRRRIAPDEVTYLGGLPLTSVARTWVDLGEVLGMPDLVAAGDSALRSGSTAEELQLVTSRAVHRRGVVRVRAALPLLDSRSRSRPESHLRYALVSAGLPTPAANEPIFDDLGQWLGEPDLSYDDVRLAIEYNGADHATTDRMRRDITREIDIGYRGRWRSVTFGPVEVFRQTDEVVAYVRALRLERLRLVL